MRKQIVLAVGVLLMMCSILVFCFDLPARAAQSTADVVVDSSEKEKIRKEIIGSVQLPGEQEEYVVGYGDVLAISVYGEGDMAASQGLSAARSPVEAGAESSGGGGDRLRRPSSGVEVRMDGRVSLLHIGDVQAVGMSITQLADYLKRLYASVYDNPIITVTLVQSNSRRYTVMGQVNVPGIFYLDFPITLVQAVARSGGFTEWANHDISVIRQGSELTAGREKKEDKKVISFDYDDFLKGRNLERNVYIEPGDVVVVH